MGNQVRITYSFEEFNKIIELSNKLVNNSSEELSVTANKFINKALTYASIKENMINIFLYPSEARFLINLLTKNINEVNVSKDWVEILKQNKEAYKKERGDY